MEVFAVTVFVSLMFAVLFATLFFAERSQRGRRSLEQDALLPLDDGPEPRRAGNLAAAKAGPQSGNPVRVESTSVVHPLTSQPLKL